MRRRYRVTIIVLALAGGVCTTANADVGAPKGWSDRRTNHTRIVSNGNATVVVSPWRTLDGLPLSDWITRIRNHNPKGGHVISAEEPLRKTDEGGFYILRHASFSGQRGYSILYACPGRNNTARLLTINVVDGSRDDTLQASNFAERYCKSTVSTLAASHDDDQSSVTASHSTLDPKFLNATIPTALRPTRAALYTNWVWSGFPATRTLELSMALYFQDGTQLGCSDWNPDGSVSLVALKQKASCAVEGTLSPEPIFGFKPGQRLNIGFGRIAGESIDRLSGAGSTLRGGDLLLNRDGYIAVGEWSAGHISASAATTRATTTRTGRLSGRYFLSGHTITIVSPDGTVAHGLTGYSFGAKKTIDTIYLNGEWYRKKK